MDTMTILKRCRHGSFNALAATKQAFGSDTAGFEARCRELLTQQMALCAQNFELLPILKDTPKVSFCTTRFMGVEQVRAGESHTHTTEGETKRMNDPYSVLGITPGADEENH